LWRWDANTLGLAVLIAVLLLFAIFDYSRGLLRWVEDRNQRLRHQRSRCVKCDYDLRAPRSDVLNVELSRARSRRDTSRIILD